MATIKDVAKRSGLSVGTVSRVFNNRGYISDEARKRVMEACKELDYYPSEIARSLYRKNTKVIGVIVPYISHPFFGMLVQSIEETCAHSGYKMMLCNSNHELAKEQDYMDMLRRNQADGIIVCSRTTDPSPYLDSNRPVISVERIISETIPAIISDNEGGGRLAADMLIDRGSLHPVLVSAQELDDVAVVPASVRNSAFLQRCAERGVEAHICQIPSEYLTEDLAPAVSATLREHPETDSVFATGDIQAIRVLHICRDLLGRKVPEELQIVGYDNIDLAAFCGLSTIAQSVREMGVFAVRTLLSIIEGEVVPNRMVLPVRFVERETTLPLNQ